MSKASTAILLTIFLGAGCASHSNFKSTQKSDRQIERLVAQVEVSQEKGDKQAFSEEVADDEFDDEFEDEFGDASQSEVFDPLSGYNRVMTDVNDTILVNVLEPVASGYRVVLPEVARLGIERFFNNLLFPVRLLNNVLQLKITNAGEESLRFGVNTTIGILGFTDPAKDWLKLEAHPEDFGQTLGFYGVGGGFHIVLPVLGPSNLRDMIGLLPDNLMNPVSYLQPVEATLGVSAVDAVNNTSLHYAEYESIKKDAVDLYPFLRDIYEQNRNKQIEE